MTVTGVGGVGKTRTALQVAEQVADQFPDGVWSVPLARLRDGALLPHAVCREMRLRDQTTRPMVEVLTDHLADQRCLLVLDGCEHLLESCALMITVLLAVAPGVRIIATSRQPLNLRGEEQFRLQPLPVSDEAVQLFAYRVCGWRWRPASPSRGLPPWTCWVRDDEATDQAIEACLATATCADRAPDGVAARAAAYIWALAS